jgi:hypothetical protein
MRAWTWVAVSTLAMACLATTAAAQVSCSNPDNLCTGDPCTINDIEVDTPCVVDFGARALVIRGRVRVPSAGTLDLTAASIQVQAHGSVNGSREEPGGVAADLALRAAGSIVMEGRLLASGRNASGDITVEAGGTLTVAGSVRSNGTTGGAVSLRGDAGVQIERFVTASGGAGGSIVVESAAGDVTVAHDVRAEGDGAGGLIALQAAGNVMVDAKVSAQGKLAGGSVFIATESGDCLIERKVRVRSSKGVGGMLSIHAGRDVVVTDHLDARGKLQAGSIDITAVVAASVLSRAGVDLRGNLPGTAHVQGASVGVGQGVRWNARTTEPGSALRFVSLSGHLTLNGIFETRSGVIEGMAATNLTAMGNFRAGPDGCIALSAGGILDTTGGVFDETIVADCPGSPSGAFLDGDA